MLILPRLRYLLSQKFTDTINNPSCYGATINDPNSTNNEEPNIES